MMSVDTERRLGDMCNLSQVLIDQGEEKGRVKGREEGRVKGREEGKVVARFEDGMNIETIAHKSQLSVERVKAILKEEGLIS
jgi:predicted transposase YdaD